VKVIHIAEVAGLGGLQNWVCSVAEAQARRGLEVELMQPPWIDPAIKVYTQLPVHEWNLGFVGGFDIVHSHGISGFENKRIVRETRKPIVHTYYGTILGIQIALRWFQNVLGWNGLMVPRNIIRESIGGRESNAVIANSSKVRSEIGRFYGVRGPKVTIIPGGYSREGSGASRESLRQELGLPADGFLFLFVGRADPVKNLPAAIEAFRRVHARFPGAYLVLAPRQDLAPDNGIVGLGLPPQRMNRLYRCVDALIHPGFYEAYSLAVHEALANGLPVIVGRNTGNADYCTDGVDAMVLPSARGTKLVDALAKAMGSLIESKELRTNLGREAERKFGPMDWDWVETETAKVYSRL
jgi:glycosyltransferase involved in cell wall biosynthesis